MAAGAAGDDVAPVEHDDAVGDIHHDVHVVFDDQDRDVHGLADVDDEAGHVLLLLEVHAGHRLVHQQHLRFHGEGAAEIDALAQAVAERADQAVADLLDLEEVDDLLDLAPLLDLLAVRPGPVEEALHGVGLHVQMAAGHQVVDDAEAREQLQALERAPHATPGDGVVARRP